MKSQKHLALNLRQDQRVNHMLERHSMGAESSGSHSLTLLRPIDHDPVESATYFGQGNIAKGVQYENNLFSSSLSQLFSRNLRLLPNNDLYGHSVDNVSTYYEEDEPFESLEEIEAQTIGNLLPKDEDLLSVVTEGLDYNVQSNGGDEMEELDLFSSVGGMDLGDDVFSSRKSNWEFPGGAINGQPGICNGSLAGEHPSRTLFVRNINSNVEDTELRILFEQYGDIHTLYTACKHRGFVTISYYDIRAAQNAMKALQNRPLWQRNLDINYFIPKENPSEKDFSQGTLVVLNLHSSVSNDELRKIFGVYGEIKEIHETPHRSQHKFIEFYDIRSAEAAFHALNKSIITGNRINIEPSRRGGGRQCLQEQDECHPYLQQNSPPSTSTNGFSGVILHGVITSNSLDNGATLGIHSATQAPVTPLTEPAFPHGISSSVPNRLPSLMRVESIFNQSSFAEPDYSQGSVKFDILEAQSFHPHSLPEYHDGFIGCNSPDIVAANISTRPPETIDTRQLCRVRSNGHIVEVNDVVFGSSGNGSCPPSGPHYAWSNSYRPQSPGMVWQHSRLPSLVDGFCTAHPSSRLHGPPRAPSRMLNQVLPPNHHHVGSAPTSANPSLWDRRPSYSGESPEASGFHPGSIGRLSNNSSHSMEFVSRNIFPRDLPIPNKNAIQSHHQRGMVFPGRSQMIPMMNTFDSPNEHARSRRNEGSSNQTDNKQQFELDIDRIKRGEDSRTTLMIKNIPNKYTSKMLLAAIDERHRGTYDFIYLPIDFKNKCNVGYAFINITDPRHIIPLYQAFNGKKWEKFNSEKVASLAYARIQGKAALIAHFQNSSLMNEDKRCRPILFNTDGPNAGDQVPFPMGVNIRTRPEKARTKTNEENQQMSLPNLVIGEDSLNRYMPSSYGKESD